MNVTSNQRRFGLALVIVTLLGLFSGHQLPGLLAQNRPALDARSPELAAVPQALTPAQLNSVFRQQAHLPQGGAANDQFGAAVAVSGDIAVVGAPNTDVAGNSNQGVAFVYKRSFGSWAFQAVLTAPDGGAGDLFGTAVAVHGTTLVIGAPFATVGDGQRGAAYAFISTAGTWQPQAKLTARDGSVGGFFGQSVAIDGESIVVGGPGATVNVGGQGAAYVFVRSGGIWSQQARLFLPDGVPNEYFAWSVDISGDTLAAGVWRRSLTDDHFQGAVFVYVRNGTDWSMQASLSDPVDGRAGYFGHSVAISGETILVGAFTQWNGSGLPAGAAYVFVRSGGIWSQQAKLTQNDGPSDDFGFAVALESNTAVIGASWAPIGANDRQGTAYVFTRSGSNWTKTARLVASDGAADDQLGTAVAIGGDTLLAGAPFDDIGSNANQGSVTFFTLQTGSWIQRSTMTSRIDTNGYSRSVGVSGDTAVAGNQFESVGGNSTQGAAYVYTRTGDTWALQTRLVAPDGAAGDRFGGTAAMQGNTLLIGAWGASIDASRRGAVYVFTRSGGTWVLQAKLTAPAGDASDAFGMSIGLDGDSAIIGAPFSDVSSTMDQGAAYVFVRSGGVWSQQTRLVLPDGQANDLFGWAVDISGDSLVTSVWRRQVGNNLMQGVAYVYVRTGGVWSQQARLSDPDGVQYAYFSHGIAISGDTVLVGAFGDKRESLIPYGAAFVFVRSGTTWTRQAKLTDNGSIYFGMSVDLEGDRAVIGADATTVGNNTDQGAVYVFRRSGSIWTKEDTLAPVDGLGSDRFGGGVALDGDTVIAQTYGRGAYIFAATSQTPTPTSTPTASATPTATATSRPTETPTATSMPTEVPTNTPTNTPTGTVAPSSTPTETSTLTPTASATSTNVPTNTPTSTATGTATGTTTASVTSTTTASNTPTASVTPSVPVTPTGTPVTSTNHKIYLAMVVKR